MIENEKEKKENESFKKMKNFLDELNKEQMDFKFYAFN